MFLPRRFVSLFLLFHLTALGIGAIPSPERLPSPDHRAADRAPRPAGPNLRVALDPAARVLLRLHAVAWKVTRPLRGPFDRYVRTLGLQPSWSLFWQPPRIDQYVRLRYYVEDEARPDQGGTSWTATELVLPAHPEDQPRMHPFRSLRDKYRDDAIISAVDAFSREVRSLPELRLEALPDDLAPLTRYFARRFERQHLSARERIARTEIWFGSAPSAPSTAIAGQDMEQSRLSVLRQYYEGPVENRLRLRRPAYPAVEKEADIVWVLDYFEES